MGWCGAYVHGSVPNAAFYTAAYLEPRRLGTEGGMEEGSLPRCQRGGSPYTGGVLAMLKQTVHIGGLQSDQCWGCLRAVSKQK